jgi:hypothetical protein
MATRYQLELIPSLDRVQSPRGYKGLHAFHKYWGKKPLEPLAFLIETLTDVNGLVIDPFMGSCATGVAALGLGRRFVGIDLNPVAVQLASVLLSPPSALVIKETIDKVEKRIRTAICETYMSPQACSPITHYLWDKSTLMQLWVAGRSRNGRVEYAPMREDIELAKRFSDYKPQRIRQPKFFNNSRINTKSDLTLHDIFTGRALRNIELLLDTISQLPEGQQLPMKMSLTASIGQMSKMVFAITGRGKTSGITSEKIEVGSWVIGYWRPALHFEVNVWNCFTSRTKKFVTALNQVDGHSHYQQGSISDVINSSAFYSLNIGDVLEVLESIPDNSADLILADPPHSDRIPYLELSELWNSLLSLEADFSQEIVVSDAKGRGKSLDDYNARMGRFVELAAKKVKRKGAVVILFNARDASSWDFLNNFEAFTNKAGVRYVGNFPITYSAGSVIQDNRKGGLKNDFALVFSVNAQHSRTLQALPNWSPNMPINN